MISFFPIDSDSPLRIDARKLLFQMSKYYVLNEYYILVVNINIKDFMFDIKLLIYNIKIDYNITNSVSM